MTVRTRFSPSPTGLLHLGNARAALFSALFAEKEQGTFILRVEDTDALRSEEHYIEALQNDLHWLDIEWQEGPNTQGKYAPYRQSARQSIYAKYYAELEAHKHIYPCFCSDQELMLARKVLLARGAAPRYSGTCKRLSADEIATRLLAGKKPAWRFSVPQGRSIDFIDTVKGPQHFQSDDIGDFIVRRADGTAPFLFCNAIDDATMAVTHVLRGEDHLANTPRQIMLLQTLNLPVPHYGHLSLIVGADGAPLSKRHGSYSLHDLRMRGYLPQAIINYLARLGHTCDTQHLLDFTHLANHFYLEKLSRSPAHFDEHQLLFWQKMAVQLLDAENFWRWLGNDVTKQVPEVARELFIKTIKANVEFPHDALIWVKIFFQDDIEMTADALASISHAGEAFFRVAEGLVERFGIDFVAVLSGMKKELGLQGKALFMPLRVALTGQTHGPELALIAELLGEEKVKQRLNQALHLAKQKKHTGAC